MFYSSETFTLTETDQFVVQKMNFPDFVDYSRNVQVKEMYKKIKAYIFKVITKTPVGIAMVAFVVLTILGYKEAAGYVLFWGVVLQTLYLLSIFLPPWQYH